MVDFGDDFFMHFRTLIKWIVDLEVVYVKEMNLLCLLSKLTYGFLWTSITLMHVQVPAVYWWYRTASHAAELTAGYYNPTNQDGYSPVFEVLKKHSVIMKFVCSGLPVSGFENEEALVDPEGLSWQVMLFVGSLNLVHSSGYLVSWIFLATFGSCSWTALVTSMRLKELMNCHLFPQILNSAWDRGLTVAGVNMLACYDREGYRRVVEMAKPRNDPDHHHFSFFVYQQPSALAQGTICFPELDYFIKCMHGKKSKAFTVAQELSQWVVRQSIAKKLLLCIFCLHPCNLIPVWKKIARVLKPNNVQSLLICQ